MRVELLVHHRLTARSRGKQRRDGGLVEPVASGFGGQVSAFTGCRKLGKRLQEDITNHFRPSSNPSLLVLHTHPSPKLDCSLALRREFQNDSCHDCRCRPPPCRRARPQTMGPAEIGTAFATVPIAVGHAGLSAIKRASRATESRESRAQDLSQKTPSTIDSHDRVAKE